MSEELDAFEKEAEMFYRDTGFLAPGKSESPAAIGQTDFDRCEVRGLMKKAWDAGRRRSDPRLSSALALIKVKDEAILSAIEQIGRCCWDGSGKPWHSKDCATPKLKAALSAKLED